VDVILPSDDETVYPKKLDASVDQKVSATNDARDMGTTSAEALVPSPIEAGAPSNPRPPITYQVPTVPCADQVMTQVELPPYR
jgi:hypothetical protein